MYVSRISLSIFKPYTFSPKRRSVVESTNDDLQHSAIDSAAQEETQTAQVGQEVKEPSHQSRTLTDEDLDNLKTHVVNDATAANKILLVGASLALVIVVIKFLHITNVFSWNGLNIPIVDAWVIFLLLTIYHYYQGCLVLVYSAHDLWVANRIDYGRVAFQEILKDQNPFVNRLRPRTRLLGKFLLPTYEMNDLPTVVSFTAAILLMAAIVPWDVSNVRRFVILIVVAIFLAIANWLIGATWIVAISELTEEHEKSTYHKRLEEKRPVLPPLADSADAAMLIIRQMIKRIVLVCFCIVLVGIVVLIFFLTS